MGNPDITDEDIIDACSKVKINNFVLRLPQTYDTIIEKNGCLFSRGQKQKIAIARGILKKTPIFLLDEINKGLDESSEEGLMEIIKDISRKATVIIVTHKLSLVKNESNILAPKDGVFINHVNNGLESALALNEH